MRDAAADHVLFQSTLSVRRATRQGRINVKEIQISIHALRKESDLLVFQQSFGEL